MCTGPKDTDCLLCPVKRKLQSIIYVGGPVKAFTEASEKMIKLSEGSNQLRNYLKTNLHPFEDRKCVKKCLTGKEFKKKYLGFLPRQTLVQCNTIKVLHPRYGEEEDQPDL